MRMTRIEAQTRYGLIKDGLWPDEEKHCITIQIPDRIARAVTNSITNRPWERVYCNRDMARPLIRALNNVVNEGILKELKTFDGCFNIRMTRGEPDKISAHAYAAAIDFNALLNPLGEPSIWSPTFIRCFTEEGFVNGASFARVDAQHFSWLGF